MLFTCQDAVDSLKSGIDWEISFFNFADSFRRESNPHIKQKLIQKPTSTGDLKLDALLQSIVMYLCDEGNLDIPDWALSSMRLSNPWFVCELSRLYSYSIVESPIRFKQNNIFVTSNFMDRK
jgi:hypothetical protein